VGALFGGVDLCSGPVSAADVAIEAVRVGAAIVRARFGKALDRVDKGHGDFATSADIDSEAAMSELVRTRFPTDLIRGEESGTSGPSAAPRSWLLDPLCGTLNYAAGTQVVAINAALLAENRVLAAAVADPFSGQIFWTDGEQANERNAEIDTPLGPTSRTSLVDLNFDPPFPNQELFRAVALAADPEFAAFRPRVVSSSLALTWVATGQRAAYVTDGDVRGSVHFAAGLAICRAAGCVISDIDGEQDSAKGLVVSADYDTHHALLRLIRRQRP
jgi:myo-inositol-1(or 4)-monophosphatase